MPAQYFDNDKRYLQWVADNPNGFVLNIGANNNPKYRVIHSAKCYSIWKLQKGQTEGAFTERGYRKVCAKTFDEIVEWIQRNGGGYLRAHGGGAGCNIETPIPLPLNVPKVSDYPDDVQSPETVIEGAKKTVVVNKYERDPAARNRCIAKWGVKCSVCGFNFEERYGALGKGFIHVHHLIPLSEIGEEYKLNPEKDLRPVCPNCHAMIHRSNPPIPIEKMKKLLRSK